MNLRVKYRAPQILSCNVPGSSRGYYTGHATNLWAPVLSLSMPAVQDGLVTLRSVCGKDASFHISDVMSQKDLISSSCITLPFNALLLVHLLFGRVPK